MSWRTIKELGILVSCRNFYLVTKCCMIGYLKLVFEISIFLDSRYSDYLFNLRGLNKSATGTTER